MQRPIMLVLAGILAVAGGCQQGPSASPGAAGGTPGDHTVREYHTLAQMSGGTEDLGQKKFANSTLELMRKVPMSSIKVHEKGYVESFTPAKPPMDGVGQPPEGVPLLFVEFTNGRLSDWAQAEAPPAGCALTMIAGAYSCINEDCAPPNVCVVTYEMGPPPANEVLSVRCDCMTWN